MHNLWRNAALAHYRLATLRFCWFAACSGAPSHLSPLGSEQGTLLVSVAPCLVVRTNALWCIAKAGTEKPVEVRNIRKASPQCDVANTDVAQVLCGKQHEGVFQPQLGDVCGEGRPRVG